jgi:TonB-dependent receptor-like protein
MRHGISIALWVVAFTSTLEAQQDSLPSMHRVSTISGEVVRKLPLDHTEELLGLRVGAFPLFGSATATRGYPGDDAILLLDGVPFQGQLFGRALLPAAIGIAEVAIVRSGASSAFGNAREGLLAVETRTGWQVPRMTLRVFTDEASPWSVGTNRLEASAGAALRNQFAFSASFLAQGNRSTELTSALQGEPLFRRTGADTVVRYTSEGVEREVAVPFYERIEANGRLPKSARDQLRAQLRVDWKPNTNTALFLSLLMGRDQERTPFGGGLTFSGGSAAGNAFLQGAQEATFERSSAAILGLSQRIGRVADGTLAANVRVARLSGRYQGGMLNPSSAAAQETPALGFTASDFEFLIDPDEFVLDAALVERFQRNVGVRTPYDIGDAHVIPRAEFRTNPYGVHDFVTSGYTAGHEFGEDDSMYYRAALQFTNDHHAAEFGAELNDGEVAYATVQLNGLIGAQFFIEKPRWAGVYARDRWKLGRLLGELGLRYDRFEPNAFFPVTPGYFNLDEPASYFRADAQSAISPSIALEYGLTNRTTLELAWSRAVGLPTAFDYYRGKNIDYFRFGNTRVGEVMGRPTALERSMNLELGAVHNLAGSSFVEIVGFWARHDDQRAVETLSYQDPTGPPGIREFLSVPTLVKGPDYGGLTVRLGRRTSESEGWNAAYTYESEVVHARRFAGDPFNPVLEAYTTTRGRHTLTGFYVQDLGGLLPAATGTVVSASARLATGSPFLNLPGTLTPSAEALGREKFADINLRLSRRLPIRAVDARVTLDGRNLLNAHRSLSVDQQALSIVVAAHRLILGGGSVVDRIDLASLEQAGPGVRTEVDLVALRQTERYFGNGDGVFAADEQMRAFSAATRMRVAATAPGGTERRVRLGVELAF